MPHVFCPVFCAPPPQWVDYSRKKFRAAFINGNFHVGEVQITNLNFSSFIPLLSRIQLGRTTVLIKTNSNLRSCNLLCSNVVS